MIRYLLLVLLILAPSIRAFALQPIVLSDRAVAVPILDHTEYLIDVEGTLQLEDIRNRPALEWKSLTTSNFGYKSYVVWLRFKLQSTAPSRRSWILTFDYPLIDTIDVWQFTRDGVIHSSIGLDQDAVTGKEANEGHFLSMNLDGGSSEFVFIRVKSEKNLELKASIKDPIHFAKDYSQEKSWLYLFYGMVVVMVMYNAFLIQFVRSRIYVYYVLYVAFYLAAALTLNGELQSFLMRLNIPPPKNLTPILLALTLIWFSLFSLNFLPLRKYSVVTYRISRVFMAFSILQFGLSFVLPYRIAIVLCFTLGTAAVIFPCFAVLLYRRGFQPARYFFLAFMSVFIAIFTTVLHKLGLLSVSTFTNNAVQLGSALEVVLLALALGDRIHHQQMEAQRINRDLHKNLETEHSKVVMLNENLEKKVFDKTHEVRSLLDYIPQGVCSIEPGLLISRHYSAHLPLLLGTDQIAEKTVAELLLQHCELTADEMDRIQQTLQACLGEHLLNFEMNESHLPRELNFKANESRVKIFEITWNADTDVFGCVQRILITIHDITQARRLEREVQKQQEDMRYIKELIDCGEEQFNRFVSSSAPLLQEIDDLLNHPALERESIKIMFVNAHTVKGAARTLRLSVLAATIHEMEHNFSRILQDQSPIDASLLKQNMELVHFTFAQYQNIHGTILKRQKTSSQINIERHILTDHCQLLQILADERSESDEERFKALLRTSADRLISSVYNNLNSVLQECFIQAERIARDMAKPAPEIQITGACVFIKPEVEDVIRRIAVHILRNILDHGIEPPEEREQCGKPPYGLIRIHSELEPEALVVLIKDDGRGLPLQKLYRKGLRAGIIGANATPQLIAQSVFNAGMSTAETVSDISGRGIGMEAIKRFVESVGGLVELSLGSPLNAAHAYCEFALKIKFPRAAVLITPLKDGCFVAGEGMAVA